MEASGDKKWNAKQVTARDGFSAYVEADFGKVFVSVPQAQTIGAETARELAQVLGQIADVADAQSALRGAREMHGASSVPAQAAEDRLDELRSRLT